MVWSGLVLLCVRAFRFAIPTNTHVHPPLQVLARVTCMRRALSHTHIHATHIHATHSMLVCGGIGAASIFGDVHSCRVADPRTYYAGGAARLVLGGGGQAGGRERRRRRRMVVWEDVELGGGEAPGAR